MPKIRDDYGAIGVHSVWDVLQLLRGNIPELTFSVA